jgi:uncharacterized protein with HEPN domain
MKKKERDYRDYLEDMAKYAEKGMLIIDNLDYDAFRNMKRRYWPQFGCWR